MVCERPPALATFIDASHYRARASLVLVPMFQGDSKGTLPLVQGESRAKRGRGSRTSHV